MDKSVTYMLVWCVISVNGATINDTQTLFKNLLEPSVYNPMIRGTMDLLRPTHVNISFSILAIEKINDLDGSMESMGVLGITWQDERLTWLPEAYNDTKEFVVSQEMVWRPEIVLANPSTSIKYLGSDRSNVRVLYNGTLLWDTADVFRAVCAIDVTSFPWDIQKCGLDFIVSDYHPNEVSLFCSMDSVVTDYFQPNGVWDVQYSYISKINSTKMSKLTFYVVLQRRALFFAVNVVIPTMILSVVNLFVFVLPVESGERVSYSITLLLSIAVFLTIVGDHLPRNSETMAAICYFTMFVLVESATINLCSIVSVAFYYKHAENSPLPAYLQNLVIFCTNRRKYNTIHDEKKTDVNDVNNVNGTDVEVQTEGWVDTRVSWRDLSQFMDRACFMAMAAMLFVSIVMFSFYVLKGRDVLDHDF